MKYKNELKVAFTHPILVMMTILIFKNYLLSIFGATLFYIGLVQGWLGV